MPTAALAATGVRSGTCPAAYIHLGHSGGRAFRRGSRRDGGRHPRVLRRRRRRNREIAMTRSTEHRRRPHDGRRHRHDRASDGQLQELLRATLASQPGTACAPPR
jgi:hypothetical protein